MEIIVEKIEDNIVVVELPNHELINVPKKLFDSVRENDVINIIVDKNKTIERKKKISKLMDQIFEDE